MFPIPIGSRFARRSSFRLYRIRYCFQVQKKQRLQCVASYGFDAFGLPAEQYAIQTGQHPAITTEQNIARYKEQLQGIGLSYDWDKEVQTCDPKYYKWTQWIFSQLYNSWYDNEANQALSIDALIARFEKSGNSQVNAACDEDTPSLNAKHLGHLFCKRKGGNIAKIPSHLPCRRTGELVPSPRYSIGK
jgi:leucyl-tRNA synthetase